MTDVHSTPVWILAALIILGIILVLPRDVPAQVAEGFRGEFLITPSDPKPAARSIIENGAVAGYDVNFPTKLAYLNPDSLDDALLNKDTDSDGIRDSIEVVPIVWFKGGVSRGLPFMLNKKNMIENTQDHDILISLSVMAKEPPFQRIGSNVLDNVVKENEGFILESYDNGDFLVKSEQYDRSILRNAASFLGACDLAFKVQCGSEIKTMVINEEKDCIENDAGVKCTENLAVCGGNVEIEMPERPDCTERRNRMAISVRGGVDAGEKNFEEIHISFWRNSDCIKGETDYLRLAGICGLDKLSGLYTYEVTSIDQVFIPA